MVAALGFERHLVAERSGERLRIGAGADDRGICRQIAAIGLDRGRAGGRRAGTRAPAPAKSSPPERTKCSTSRSTKAERVRGVAVLAHQQAAHIVARQGGLELAQLVGVEFVDLDPVLAAQIPGEAILFQALGER